MSNFIYPAQFEPVSEGGFVVSFRDVPEALTQGDTLEEAKEYALDALITSVDFYVERGEPFPAPSQPRADEILIALPASVSAKILLLNAMTKAKVRPADLARRLGIKPQQVVRILSLRHKTKIDTLQQAFGVLGYSLDLGLSPSSSLA